MLILSIVVLVMVFALGLNSYQAKKLAGDEDRIIQITLEQTVIDLELKLEDTSDHERLSDVDHLNELLEPTEETFRILKRWEIVHQIDPDYPYPVAEIEERDWMGINYFLYGDFDDEEGAAKAEMTYDENNNIDSDILDFIMSDISSDHPVVVEAMERMKNEEQ